MLDVAANLNEAYAVEKPLATLLQRHRLLAMSHGPIKLRVDTLRSLADADPENPIGTRMSGPSRTNGSRSYSGRCRGRLPAAIRPP